MSELRLAAEETVEGRRVCRICARRIYRALGAEDIRHRRTASTEVLMRRFLSLDYVIEHSDLPWLPTEHEKVAAFEALGIERGLLPVRVYRGAAGSTHAATSQSNCRWRSWGGHDTALKRAEPGCGRVRSLAARGLARDSLGGVPCHRGPSKSGATHPSGGEMRSNRWMSTVNPASQPFMSMRRLAIRQPPLSRTSRSSYCPRIVAVEPSGRSCQAWT